MLQVLAHLREAAEKVLSVCTKCTIPRKAREEKKKPWLCLPFL
jgi:hypothetical protein